MALCWQAVILSLRSRSLKSVNAGDVKNKCLSVQPWWFHPNQLSWLAGSLPLHNSRGGLTLVHLPTLFCGYITCRAFMLQHGFFFFQQGHLQPQCENSDFDSAQHVSVSSLRPRRPRLCTHSFCLRIKIQLDFHSHHRHYQRLFICMQAKYFYWCIIY